MSGVISFAKNKAWVLATGPVSVVLETALRDLSPSASKSVREELEKAAATNLLFVDTLPDAVAKEVLLALRAAVVAAPSHTYYSESYEPYLAQLRAMIDEALAGAAALR